MSYSVYVGDDISVCYEMDRQLSSPLAHHVNL